MRNAKFDDSEPQRCEDMEGIVTPEIGPKSFGSFEKQATGQSFPQSLCWPHSLTSG